MRISWNRNVDRQDVLAAVLVVALGLTSAGIGGGLDNLPWWHGLAVVAALCTLITGVWMTIALHLERRRRECGLFRQAARGLAVGLIAGAGMGLCWLPGHFWPRAALIPYLIVGLGIGVWGLILKARRERP